MDVFNEIPWLFVGLAVLAGLLVGSFLNVVIYRLPKMLMRQWNHQAKLQLGLPLSEEETARFNLLTPPSHCPGCHTPIKPFRNIPLLSFLLLKGRCPNCHTKISWQYPAVELLTGLGFGVVAWHFGPSAAAVAGMVLTAFVVAMTFIDAQTQLLPDQLTLTLLWLGLLLNINAMFAPLPSAVLGAVVGYMSLWVLYQAFKLFTGKEGMGYGDFKLFAALGAWFGLTMLPLIILVSSLVGIVFALANRLGWGKQTPFGPYLALAGWGVLIFQHPLTRLMTWWLHKSGF